MSSRASKRQSVVQADQPELDRQVAAVQHLDTCCKEICSGCKTACQSLKKCAPAEWELVMGLMQHSDQFPELQSCLDQWQGLVRAKELAYDQLANHITRFVAKPMAQLQRIQPCVARQVKRRERKQSEEASLESNLAKEEAKSGTAGSRTGKRLAALAYLRRDLESTKSQLAQLNEALLTDLQALQAARPDYARPCVRALAQAEAQHFDQLAQLCARVSDCFAAEEDFICLTADSYAEMTKDRLKQIRALSIVADTTDS
ncbi:hypothetical protein BOX15_Mlig022137g1 [Macrostomum lignano]|uniref:Uncharacterized protein n=1 Tax=Macrostomum lignano TaxID=282301 RepID=A0A267H510_9PLAT|nr:hypothetical protein BOX15_Mlig022137g1 [Macrostomum lignano]